MGYIQKKRLRSIKNGFSNTIYELKEGEFKKQVELKLGIIWSFIV